MVVSVHVIFFFALEGDSVSACFVESRGCRVTGNSHSEVTFSIYVGLVVCRKTRRARVVERQVLCRVYTRQSLRCA